MLYDRNIYFHLKIILKRHTRIIVNPFYKNVKKIKEEYELVEFAKWFTFINLRRYLNILRINRRNFLVQKFLLVLSNYILASCNVSDLTVSSERRCCRRTNGKFFVIHWRCIVIMHTRRRWRGGWLSLPGINHALGWKTVSSCRYSLRAFPKWFTKLSLSPILRERQAER